MPASPPCTTGRTTRARPPMPTPSCARIAMRCCAPAMPMGTSTGCRATRRSTSPTSTASSGSISPAAPRSRASSPSGSTCAACRRATSAPSTQDMKAALERGLPIAIHASQAPPNVGRRRGLREARLARPQSAALPLHSGARHRCRDHGADQDAAELRDPFGVSPGRRRRSARRAAAHAQGRRRWSRCRSTPPRSRRPTCSRPCASPGTWASPGAARRPEGLPPVGFREVIEMATLNGAKALGPRRRHRLAHRRQARRHHPDPRQRHQRRAARQYRDHGRAVRHAGQRRHRPGGRPHRQAPRQARRLRRREGGRDAKASSLRIRTAAGGVLTPPTAGR